VEQDILLKLNKEQQFVEVYHVTMQCAEQFMRLSINIPKQLLKVVQNIHGEFDNVTLYIYHAANTYNIKEKLDYLNLAIISIEDIYHSLDYIVRVKGLSIGATNTIITILKKALEQINYWKAKIESSKDKPIKS